MAKPENENATEPDAHQRIGAEYATWKAALEEQKKTAQISRTRRAMDRRLSMLGAFLAFFGIAATIFRSPHKDILLTLFGSAGTALILVVTIADRLQAGTQVKKMSADIERDIYWGNYARDLVDRAQPERENTSGVEPRRVRVGRDVLLRSGKPRRLRSKPRPLSRQGVIDEAGKIARARLEQQVAALSLRANYNLALGIVVSGTGITVLASSVYLANDLLHSSVPQRVMYLVPRASLSLVIELLAYFFLRLYRQTLAEVRYVHNELSNAEARYAAVSAGMRERDPKARAKLLQQLVSTERNFVLEKGQSTIEAEIVRADSRAAVEFARSLGRLPQVITPKVGKDE